MHYLLFYDVVPDYAERRTPFRAEHLALARAAHQWGELVLGGAFADPIDGAVFPANRRARVAVATIFRRE